jgi:outer membrane protein assembly factor BamB
MNKPASFGLLGALLLVVLVGADWPQWRGPHRDEVSSETGLLKSWPEGGPRLVFTLQRAGAAYSPPAIVGNRLYCMGARGKDDYVYAVDLQNGKTLWTQPIGIRYSNGYGDGPRGAPTVDGDLLFALSGQGDLACLNTDTGSKRWSKRLAADLGGTMPGWGYSESPLVDGDKVVCTPGGDQGTIAALDKQTGKVEWRSSELKEAAMYSSIVVAVLGGVRQYIQMTRGGVVGVAGDDGRLLWRSDAGGNGTAVIPTPVVRDNLVYVTSGYGSGCGLVKLTSEGIAVRAETVYKSKEMQNQHGGVVLVGDHIYGCSDPGIWRCQELKTGKVLWESRKLGKGSLTYADGNLYCYSEDGKVALVEASPKGWKEKGRFQIPEGKQESGSPRSTWTHPVVANGRLFLRNQDFIFIFDVREGSTPAASAAGVSRILDFDVPPPGIQDWITQNIPTNPAQWSMGAYYAAGMSLLLLLVGVLVVRDVRKRRAVKP